MINIEELKKLDVEATPGPWREFICDDGGEWTGWPLSIEAVNKRDKTVVRTGGQWPYEWDASISQNEAVANAALIAAARNSLPELLAKAEAHDALVAALTPSADTKADYMGEFHMGVTLYARGQEDYRRVTIPWETIKEIMKAISARAAFAKLGGTDVG